MSITFDHVSCSGPDLLAELGFDSHAIQQIFDEPPAVPYDVRDSDQNRVRD